MKGKLVFEQTSIGSKSERKAPYLYAEEKKIPLFAVGDNPFENNVLRPFDGKFVDVSGEYDDNVFLVQNVLEISEEAFAELAADCPAAAASVSEEETSKEDSAASVSEEAEENARIENNEAPNEMEPQDHLEDENQTPLKKPNGE